MADNTGDWEQHEGDVSMPLEAVGYNKGWDAGIKQGGAQVLAACIKHFEKEAGKCADFANKEAGESRAAWNRQEAWYEDCADAIRKLQPTASDLEELLEQAHEAALPHAAEQLVKALTEGGEFIVGSPLAKVKQRVEALLREAELEMLERIRTNEGGVYVYCPERENTEGPAIIRLDVFIRVKKRQISELEKARAEGKG